jgi:hypothetical protein
VTRGGEGVGNLITSLVTFHSDLSSGSRNSSVANGPRQQSNPVSRSTGHSSNRSPDGLPNAAGGLPQLIERGSGAFSRKSSVRLILPCYCLEGKRRS